VTRNLAQSFGKSSRLIFAAPLEHDHRAVLGMREPIRGNRAAVSGTDDEDVYAIELIRRVFDRTRIA
jgi:hypothetical protein